MSDMDYEAPPEETAAPPSDPALQQFADVDPFDTPALMGAIEQFRDQVQRGVDERLAAHGFTPAGESVPEIPEFVRHAQAETQLGEIVRTLGEQPGFEHLQGVDIDAVLQKAHEITPQVVAAMGATNEAAAHALLLAAQDVATEEHGKSIVDSEIKLLGLAYKNDFSPSELSLARASAEQAYENGMPVRDAIRKGFEEATGVNLTTASSPQRVAYFGIRGKLINEQILDQKRADSRGTSAKPVTPMHERIAKYGKRAHDIRVEQELTF